MQFFTGIEKEGCLTSVMNGNIMNKQYVMAFVFNKELCVGIEQVAPQVSYNKYCICFMDEKYIFTYLV